MTGTELAEVIQIVADKFEIAATELVSIFSEAQVGVGVIHLIQMFVIVCVMYFVVKKTLNYLISQTGEGKKWYEGHDGEDRIFHFCVVVSVSGFLTIITTIIVGEAILHIIYPEYYGIKELITTLVGV